MSVRHKKHSDLPDGADPSKVHPSDWNDEHVDENGDPIGLDRSVDGSTAAITDSVIGTAASIRHFVNGASAYNKLFAIGESASNDLGVTGDDAYNRILAEGVNVHNEIRASGTNAENQITATGLLGRNLVATDRPDNEVLQLASQAAGTTARLYVCNGTPVGLIAPWALPAICLADTTLWVATGLTNVDWKPLLPSQWTIGSDGSLSIAIHGVDRAPQLTVQQDAVLAEAPVSIAVEAVGPYAGLPPLLVTIGGVGQPLEIDGDGLIILDMLPTADPTIGGALWLDVAAGRVLKVSAG